MASTTGSVSAKKTTGKKSASRPSGSSKPGTGGRATASRGRTRKQDTEQGLRLHTAHASVPIPYITKSDLSAGMHAAESVLPSVKMPPPERLAFYGGLGALAAVGVVEWPVAAAIGVATMVARRGRHGKDDKSMHDKHDKK